MTDAASPEPAADESEVAAERRRSRRSVSFILAVVGAAVAVIILLALWVLVVPYTAEVSISGVGSTRCDDVDRDGGIPSALVEACDQHIAEARDERRTTAFVVGVGAFVVAAAVSTWPSRRLTGDRLGPLR